MKIEVVDSTSGSLFKLNQFVTKHQLLFNSEAWLKNYDGSNLVRCAILNNNNDVIGCFIYYVFKKTVFKFVISPPYTPHIDLFYENPSQSIVGKHSFTKEILTHIANYFSALNVQYINLNLPDEIVDTQPFTWGGYTSRSRYTYLIDLGKQETELWDNLSTEKRKSINKALKDGLLVKRTTDFELVYSLILKSLERNQKAKNTSIIRNILFRFANEGNSIAFIAFQNEVPIGATFCVRAQNKAMYLFGGFDLENKHHGAGVSCMWQSILEARKEGLKYFDFEGSMNTSIERYFREFGGTLHPYHCIEKIKPVLNMLLKLKKHNPV